MYAFGLNKTRVTTSDDLFIIRCGYNPTTSTFFLFDPSEKRIRSNSFVMSYKRVPHMDNLYNFNE